MPACVRKPRVCGAHDGHRRPKPSYRRCHAIENPLARGGSQVDLCPGLPGWVADDHEETHYFPPVIASHPSRAGPLGTRRYLITVNSVVVRPVRGR